MLSQRFPQSRAERLIAIGRFVLAVAAFGAIWLDPLEPAQYPALAYSLLAGYSVYSLAVLLWNVAASTTTRRALLITHVLDLVFFGVLNATTFGPTSPFFVFFVFSISCAMLRFGRQGTVLTAGLAVVVYIASSIAGASAAQFELNRFIIRVTYLFVLASMLIYLAAYQEHIQHDLGRIARWPRSVRRDYETLLAQLLSWTDRRRCSRRSTWRASPARSWPEGSTTTTLRSSSSAARWPRNGCASRATCTTPCCSR